jgi:hypothetical protein
MESFTTNKENFSATIGNARQQYIDLKNEINTSGIFVSDNDYLLSLKLDDDTKLIFNCSLLKNAEISIENEITDYVLEKNAKVQDHISHAPIEISLNVMMYWYVDEAPKKITGQSFIENKLSAFSGFAPNLSIKAQEYYNKATDLKRKVEAAARKVDNGVNFFLNILETSGNNPYLTAYKVLKNASDIGMTLTVNSSFASIENMVIKSLRFSNSNDIDNANITISLKQINLAKKSVALVGRLKSQKAQMVNNGVQQGDERSVLLKGSQNLGVLK